ncbi:MAG TPA: S41 family peptidase [Blastocatellia bacterium]|nr:S41 family peptidase [Blastocatellia bacterium]
MRKHWQKFLLFGVIVGLVVSSALFRSFAAGQMTAEDRAAELKLRTQFVEAIEVIRDNYLEEVEYELLTKVGIQGMLRNLDPHSSFYDKKAFDDLRNDQRSQYFGIGSVITMRDGRVVIIEPFRDTPSIRAGLRYGDQIVGIDGQNTENWDQTQVTRKLRGEQGTKVNVSVRRAGVAEPITVTIERDAIAQMTITAAYIIRPGIGYICMPRGFHSTTNDELTAAIASLKEQGATSMILDLRDNPGGFLEQALKVSDKFLQRGQTITTVRYRDGSVMSRDLQAETGSPENFPLVVLIDKNSASASEIVAGAVQDHDRGLIVGETSFGKGLVQTIMPLSGGYGLTLTTARYYTPSGRLIQRDYSNNSAYDYFYKRAGIEVSDESKKTKTWMTDLRRPVYGGGGINPDVKVKDTKIENLNILNQTQLMLLSPIFLYVRDLVGGQVDIALNFKLNGPPVFDRKLGVNEFPVTEPMMKLFRERVAAYLKKHPEINVTPAAVEEQMSWARNRIRYEALLAAYGADKAQQAMNDLDAQLQRAVTELPNAAALAERARRARNVSSK